VLSKVKACGLQGIDGYIVDVETDISNGIPAFDIVGLGDTAVRESKERVRTAIKNSGFEFPLKRITINLAPANLRKEGSAFDLPVALGILTATGQVNTKNVDEYMFLGELSLDGEIKPVKGSLSAAICAAENGLKYLITPLTNADEASVVESINVLPAGKLLDVINHINGNKYIERNVVDMDAIFSQKIEDGLDFADVKGQASVKRAIEVAASGAHNCIMFGSPGCGKTMIARRLPGILPGLTFDEALEVTKIYSIEGLLPRETSLITQRPFRAPHHTISSAGLVGGGKYPKPGEISLAHYGVLFLDEVPEFSKSALEVLRQPLEDGKVTITRSNTSITYPSQITLIMAANPCKCGYLLDPDHECTCTPRQIKEYIGKLSGPLMDRIDIQIDVISIRYNELESKKSEEKSEVIRERVEKARKIQQERYKGLGIYSNSELTPSMIKQYCGLDKKGREFLKNAFEKLSLSARAHNRILKVARTIADMEEKKDITYEHVAEAIQYRSLDRSMWKR